MSRYSNIEVEVEWSVGEDEVNVTVRGTVSPVIRGCYHGPPERCYPDEGGEVEIVEVVLEDGSKWAGELTTHETDRLEEMLREAADKEMESRYADAASDAAEARAEMADFGDD